MSRLIIVGRLTSAESCSWLRSGEIIPGGAISCSSMEEVIREAANLEIPPVLIVDLRLAGTLTGLSNFKKNHPGTYAIAVVNQGEPLLEDALSAGYDDFIFNPVNDCELALRVKKAVLRQESTFFPEAAKGRKQGAFYSAARVLGDALFGALLLVLAAMAFLLVQDKLDGAAPSIAGYQVYVVLSGSMKPAFDTGSLIFVRPADPEAIRPGDVITFKGAGGGNLLTTHRVVKIERENGLQFITRGDANKVNDPQPVSVENLVGKVYGSVPYLGYLMGFAQTKKGLVFLVFIPGLLVIIYELRNIYRYTTEKDNEKQKKGCLRSKKSRQIADHQDRYRAVG